MTDHPAANVSQAARDLFEQIAINNDRNMDPVLVRELMAADLIVVGPHNTYVPIAIHYQWCVWASENVDPDEFI